MRYVAAYLLAVLGGNEKPTTKVLEGILGSVGVEADATQLKLVVDALKGKNIEELIAEGMGKLASMPSGGGGSAGGAAAPAGGDAAPDAAKEEKKPEPESESDDDMGFDLFG
uniref:Large ribosomal subunit protein P2 n=1 Tax=Flustra foliacea TaxID=478208 RepID=A9UDV5_9BILA|nr:putative 60S ribosomal protein RPLP2 [Flustra foliacea]